MWDGELGDEESAGMETENGRNRIMPKKLQPNQTNDGEKRRY